MKNESLRERLFAQFNILLPISGGTGESIENAVVITAEGCARFVEVQFHVLDLVWKARGLPWELHKKSMHEHYDRMIDKLVIKTREVSEHNISYRYENFFFDVTGCLETRLIPGDDLI